jgi:hypothetical protein
VAGEVCQSAGQAHHPDEGRGASTVIPTKENNMSKNEPTLPQASDLVTLVSFTFKFPGGIKVHKSASEELRQSKKVKKKSRAKVTVDILSSEDLADARKQGTAARNFLYKNSLAFEERNQRAVPNVLLDKVHNGLEEFGAKADVHFEEFIASHSSLQERFKQEAGDLETGVEFPTVEQLREKYSWMVDTDVAPDVTKLANVSLVGVTKQVEDSFKKRLVESHERKIARATDDVTKRVTNVISEVVDHMDKFGRDGEGKLVGGFKDSLIGNVRELAGNLKAFNITNDPALEEVRKLLVDKVCKIDPQTLRDSEPLRREVKKDAEAILSKVGRFGKRD